jgi:hypothetical protein
MTKGAFAMTTDPNLRLPASELAKLEPARARRVAHVAPPVEVVHAPRRLRRVVRSVVGISRA